MTGVFQDNVGISVPLFLSDANTHPLPRFIFIGINLFFSKKDATYRCHYTSMVFTSFPFSVDLIQLKKTSDPFDVGISFIFRHFRAAFTSCYIFGSSGFTFFRIIMTRAREITRSR